MAISSITLAELLHGVEKSEFVERNLRKVEDFISRLEVLDYTPGASAHYGDIRAAGRPHINFCKNKVFSDTLVFVPELPNECQPA